ncbi:hypothetical protein SAMN05444278_1252 [Psychroflexus salarius]|uniref:Lycopene cyclase domain-containing protein n=1 Tax=Psychroflexus salarius TaxID=1155689 RepID=A0A1M4YD88_9FLAO|nr:hypothetical protein SAMN05444278_1252 [Psychroflexus salarius]
MELHYTYLKWLLTITIVLILFQLISKKRNYLILLVLVLLPTWIILSILRGLEYYVFNGSGQLFYLKGFINLLAETLPTLILFGASTFFIRHIIYCNKNEK